MKKAFTLAETLVTLAIIGVLAAILVPGINNVRPDKDKIVYKKALYNMQSAISNAMDSSLYSQVTNSAAYWGDENVKQNKFCEAMADALNTRGKINCGDSGSSYSNPNFVTSDGIKYWGLEDMTEADKFTSSGDKQYKIIHVDRELNSGDKTLRKRERVKLGDWKASDSFNSKSNDGLKIRVRYNGKIDTPDPNSTDATNVEKSFHYENDLIENTFDVGVGKSDNYKK